MKEFKIIAPKGKIIDAKALENGRIEFIDEPKKLPQSWEELGEIDGFCIGCVSEIYKIESKYETMPSNYNIIPSKQRAEAILALIQLMQLMDAYNGCPAEELDRDSCYQVSIFYEKTLRSGIVECTEMPLPAIYFKTPELRDKFVSAPEIGKLIEIAMPVL